MCLTGSEGREVDVCSSSCLEFTRHPRRNEEAAQHTRIQTRLWSRCLCWNLERLRAMAAKPLCL